jgi:MFS family permease
MKQDAAQSSDEQVKWILESKSNAERKHRRLRRLNTQTIITGLLASTFATVLAGYTAASNSPLMSWRWTCALVAVFTLCATIATGLQKQFDISGNISKISGCLGRLSALELAVRLGTRAREEIAKECEEIAVLYPDFIG